MMEKYKKPLIIIGSLILLYTIVGFLVVPAVLESQLPKIVHEVTGRKTSVEKIEFNPYAMTLSIKGYETQEPDGPRFVGFDELFVNFQPWASLFKMAVTLDEIRLAGFYGHIAVLGDHSLNFSDLLALGSSEPEEVPEEDDGEMFPLWISHLKIENSEVEFDDFALKEPFKAKITPIDLHLKNLTTLIEEGTPSTLTANFLTGGSLSWQGNISLNPLHSRGHLDIAEVDVHKAWTYIQGLVNFEIQEGGMINMAADYSFDGSGDELQFLIPSATFSLDGFKLSEKGQELSLIDIPGFAIEGIAFDLARQQVTVANASTQDGVIKGWLSPDGVFNYQTLFVPGENDSTTTSTLLPSEDDSANTETAMASTEGKPAEAKPSTAPAEVQSTETKSSPAVVEDKPEEAKASQETTEIAVAAAAPATEKTSEPVSSDAAPLAPSAGVESTDLPWLVTVNEVSLNNYAINIEDRTQKEVIAINLSPVNITVNNISTKPGEKLQINTDITVNETGRITIKGDAGFDPVLTNLEMAVEKIALKTFQPYLGSVAHLNLVNGAVNVDGKLNFSLGENDQPSLSYAGNASVVNLHMVDARDVPAGHKDIFKWKALNVNKVEFDLDPMKVKVGGVESDSAFARVIINKDGTTNLAEIFAASEGNSGNQPEPAKKPEPKTTQVADSPAEIPPISIGQVKIKNASAFFADLSLILPFGVQMGNLNGAVKGLSSDEKSRAEISLKGKVDKVSPVIIQGSVNPFHPDTHSNIRMQFKSVNLTTATPYMAQFAGYKVDKGTISLDLNYKISKRKLDANNQVVIDQLTLGEEIDSPDAVSIPIKLAIALLKDSNGVIDLELPISGSLDDPEFNIGALVGKVLVTLLEKIVLSPFTLIASLAGSDDDLSQIEFANGYSTLSVKQKQRLDTIATGIKERPELQIEVRGAAYQSMDWSVIAENLLMKQLKQSKWDELNEDGEAPATSKEIELSLSEYERLLGELFSENFPQEAETFESAQVSDDRNVSSGFYTMAKEKLIDTMPVNKSALKLVAKTRAENISEYLIEQGKISHDRIFLMDLLIEPDAPEGGLVTVPLTLTAS